MLTSITHHPEITEYGLQTASKLPDAFFYIIVQGIQRARSALMPSITPPIWLTSNTVNSATACP